MPLEFTGVPPVPRGMNLAGPPVFIDEAYCRWMQDVLVDRPGQIRMRGPLSYWLVPGSTGISASDQIIGATETYVSDSNGVPQWRGAVFVADNTNTTGTSPTGGYMRVFKNPGNSPAAVGTVTLPFTLTTKYNSSTKRWTNNTIIDAKPALGGGVWIGVLDDVTNSASAGVSALFYWRGAGLPDYTSAADASYNTSGNTRNIITHSASVAASVEPGMFAFNTSDYSYLGIVTNVAGGTVTLEKNVIVNAYDASLSSQTIAYTSVRGFVHQYGRGFGSYDGGNYLTSGRLGTDAEGFFKAANVTINGSSTASDHKVNVYRNDDHQFIGKVAVNGIVSNTQVEVPLATAATRRGDYLEDEAYFILRNDVTMYLNSSDGVSRRYPIDLTYRRPDMRPGILTNNSNTTYLSAAPGIFNSTYAGRQWFASFNTANNTYDKYINRVVFSSTDNSENINLAPDASDSIIIPGQENIRGIAGSNTGLLVFTESKTYIIRGTQRANFSLEELYPDGCLSAPSIVQVGGGVIWAGKQGIYYYDGASVRNFTPEALGVYYTDGIKNFDTSLDRIYAFVYNNYLVINFTNWFSNYTLKRWQYDSNEVIDGNNYTVIKNTGNIREVNPDRITFSIYLPTGAIGTLSNFTPRGYMNGIMCMNSASNTVAPPTNSTGILLNLKTIFTENVDDNDRDGQPTNVIYSNDSVYSIAGTRFTGPDFYVETKQYNWQEPTLKKWFRKLLFNLSINKGTAMIEFVDINDKSLVSPVTGSDPPKYSSYDESGFFLIPSTSYAWEYFEELGETGALDWDDIQNSTLTWAVYFQGVQVRYSKWLGIRQNSLAFRMYGLHDYIPVGDATEQMPEIVNISDWVWGLKPLRGGRN